MTATQGDRLSAAAEAAVVALARLGEGRAFEELVRRRQAQIRNLLRRLCRDAALADDLAQDAFLKAWKSIGRLQSAGAFGGWLRQIAVNTWLHHARRREPLAELDDDDPSAPATTTLERLDLDSALGTLPPVVRLCIVLSYQEGLSHGEIATTTGVPVGTVKSHISRGAARLRKLLGAYDSTPERSIHA